MVDEALRNVVLDAHFLIRAALGQSVRHTIVGHCKHTGFFTPAGAFEEVRQHLPRILAKRKLPCEALRAVLERLAAMAQPIEAEEFGHFQGRPKRGKRHAADWQILALALTFDALVWTQGAAFFWSRGC